MTTVVSFVYTPYHYIFISFIILLQTLVKYSHYIPTQESTCLFTGPLCESTPCADVVLVKFDDGTFAS